MPRECEEILFFFYRNAILSIFWSSTKYHLENKSDFLSIFLITSCSLQALIVFKTPAYCDKSIDQPRSVCMQLRRKKDIHCVSDTHQFMYKPVHYGKSIGVCCFFLNIVCDTHRFILYICNVIIIFLFGPSRCLFFYDWLKKKINNIIAYDWFALRQNTETCMFFITTVINWFASHQDSPETVRVDKAEKACKEVTARIIKNQRPKQRNIKPWESFFFLRFAKNVICCKKHLEWKNHSRPQEILNFLIKLNPRSKLLTKLNKQTWIVKYLTSPIKDQLKLGRLLTKYSVGNLAPQLNHQSWRKSTTIEKTV